MAFNWDKYVEEEIKRQQGKLTEHKTNMQKIEQRRAGLNSALSSRTGQTGVYQPNPQAAQDFYNQYENQNKGTKAPKEPSKKDSLIATLKKVKGLEMPKGFEMPKVFSDNGGFDLGDIGDAFQKIADIGNPTATIVKKGIGEVAKNVKPKDVFDVAKQTIKPTIEQFTDNGGLDLGDINDLAALSNPKEEIIKGYALKDYADKNTKGLTGQLAKTGSNIRAGVGDMTEFVGNSMSYIGNKYDLDELKKTGKEIGDWSNEHFIKDFEKPYTKPFTWKSMFDPDLYSSDIARSMPFLAAMMPVAEFGAVTGTGISSVIANIVKATPKITQNMAKVGQIVGATGFTTLMESLFEAANVYQDLVDSGKPEEEADDLADKVFKKNMWLLGITNVPEMIAYFAPPGVGAGLSQTLKKVGGVGLSVLSEGYQEGEQEVISSEAMGQELTPSQLWQARFTGGVMGGVFSLSGSLTETEGEQPQPVQSATAPTQPPTGNPQQQAPIQQPVQPVQQPVDTTVPSGQAQDIPFTPQDAEQVNNVLSGQQPDLSTLSEKEQRDYATQNDYEVYHASSNVGKILSEGFDPEKGIGEGSLTGQKNKSGFGTFDRKRAEDYVNLYNDMKSKGQQGLDDIGLVKVKLKKGTNDIKGNEVRFTKDDILSVQRLDQPSTEMEDVEIEDELASDDGPVLEEEVPEEPPMPKPPTIDFTPGEKVNVKGMKDEFEVVDATDRAMLVLKSPKGGEMKVGRKAVTKVEKPTVEQSNTVETEVLQPQLAPEQAQQPSIEQSNDHMNLMDNLAARPTLVPLAQKEVEKALVEKFGQEKLVSDAKTDKLFGESAISKLSYLAKQNGVPANEVDELIQNTVHKVLKDNNHEVIPNLMNGAKKGDTPESVLASKTKTPVIDHEAKKAEVTGKKEEPAKQEKSVKPLGVVFPNFPVPKVDYKDSKTRITATFTPNSRFKDEEPKSVTWVFPKDENGYLRLPKKVSVADVNDLMNIEFFQEGVTAEELIATFKTMNGEQTQPSIKDIADASDNIEIIHVGEPKKTLNDANKKVISKLLGNKAVIQEIKDLLEMDSYDPTDFIIPAKNAYKELVSTKEDDLFKKFMESKNQIALFDELLNQAGLAPKEEKPTLDEGAKTTPKTERYEKTMYHATHAEIEEFTDIEIKNYNSIGTWFTSDSKGAKKWYGPNVYEAKVTIQSPLYAKTEDFDSVFFIESIAKKYIPAKQLKDPDDRVFQRLFTNKHYITEVKNYYVNQGYDGFVFKNSTIDRNVDGSEGTHDVVTAFFPSKQVKKAQEPPPNVQPNKYDKMRDRLEFTRKAAENARKRLKDRHKDTIARSGLPMDDLIDYSIIGMDKLAHKMIDIAEFTEEFVKEFGENIRDWIPAIYGQSMAMLDYDEARIDKMLQDAYGDESVKAVEEEVEEPKNELAPNQQLVEGTNELVITSKGGEIATPEQAIEAALKEKKFILFANLQKPEVRALAVKFAQDHPEFYAASIFRGRDENGNPQLSAIRFYPPTMWEGKATWKEERNWKLKNDPGAARITISKGETELVFEIHRSGKESKDFTDEELFADDSIAAPPRKGTYWRWKGNRKLTFDTIVTPTLEGLPLSVVFGQDLELDVFGIRLGELRKWFEGKPYQRPKPQKKTYKDLPSDFTPTHVLPDGRKVMIEVVNNHADVLTWLAEDGEYRKQATDSFEGQPLFPLLTTGGQDTASVLAAFKRNDYATIELDGKTQLIRILNEKFTVNVRYFVLDENMKPGKTLVMNLDDPAILTMQPVSDKEVSEMRKNAPKKPTKDFDFAFAPEEDQDVANVGNPKKPIKGEVAVKLEGDRVILSVGDVALVFRKRQYPVKKKQQIEFLQGIANDLELNLTITEQMADEAEKAVFNREFAGYENGFTVNDFEIGDTVYYLNKGEEKLTEGIVRDLTQNGLVDLTIRRLDGNQEVRFFEAGIETHVFKKVVADDTMESNGGEKSDGLEVNSDGTLEETPTGEVQGTATDRETSQGSRGTGGRNDNSDSSDVPGTTEGRPSTNEQEPSGHDVPQQHADETSGGNESPSDIRGGTSKVARNNFIVTDELDSFGSLKDRYKANIAALRLLHELTTNERLATIEEQKILTKYIGWGGLAPVFDKKNRAWSVEYQEMLNLVSEGIITQKEYETARKTTQYAHYTAKTVINAMYDALKRMGFKGGRILEPSMGIGNFFGLLPSSMRGSSVLTGVEMDPLTGKIAKQLYQKTNIEIKKFQDFEIADGYFDVAIGNPPYSDLGIKYGTNKHRLHNFFFLKSLDKVHAGGIVAFVTSSGTLNAKDSFSRKQMAEKADFLGAIRLPDNAFKANAGTEVTADILFFQKREEGAEPNHRADFIETQKIEVEDRKGEKAEVRDNVYFINHPEMVLGNVTTDKLVVGAGGQRLGVTSNGQDISTLLAEAIQKLPKNIYQNATDQVKEIEYMEEVKSGLLAELEEMNFGYENDTLVQKVQGKIVKRSDIIGAKRDRIISAIGVRDAAKKLLLLQMESDSDEKIKASMKELNTLYDRFVKKYKVFNSQYNMSVLKQDPLTLSLLISLEKEENGNWVKQDVFYERVISYVPEIKEVKTEEEALVVSLFQHGRVDLPYMSELLKRPQEDIVKALGENIVEDPENGWVTADEYLSGNVRVKLEEAKMAAKTDKKFEKNVSMLEKVIPEDIPSDDIFIQFGSPFVPDSDVTDFVNEFIGQGSGNVKVSFIPITGTWIVEGELWNVRNQEEFGVTSELDGGRSITAVEIIENVLNNKDPKVTYKAGKDINGKAIYEVDQDATALARQKAVELESEFQDWMFSDKEREARIVRRYNDDYNSVILREYNGTLIYGGNTVETNKPIPGGFNNKKYILKKHQKDVVWRMVQGGNALLAHVVGAGKTLEMVVAGMEMKRLGLIKKPAYVVPVSLVEQWEREFRDAYPNANILMLSNDLIPSVATTKSEIAEDIPLSGDLSKKLRQGNSRIKITGESKKFTYLGMKNGKVTVASLPKKVEERRKILEQLALGKIDPVEIDYREVPRNQIEKLYREMSDEEFEAKQNDRRIERAAALNRIALGNYDAIIISHETFKRLSMTAEAYEEFIREQIMDLQIALESLVEEGGENSYTVKQLENAMEKLEEKLAESLSTENKDIAIPFERLGIDQLFVDEAHKFKNLGFQTKMQRISGLSNTEAQRSTDMFVKTRWLTRFRDGKGVVFATGTPISNTMAEMYSMMRYLMYDRMKDLAITHFDAWANMFGQTETSIEMDVAGGFKERTRFKKFKNLRELMRLFREAADIRTAQMLDLPRPKNVQFKEVVSQLTEEQKDYLAEIVSRADSLEGGSVDPKDDNWLKLTGDARRMSVDIRLADPTALDNPNSKTNMAVKNIFDIWKDTTATRKDKHGEDIENLAQLVFLDLGTPKEKALNEDGEEVENENEEQLAFDVYSDIRRKLIQRGIPKEQIAFIHEAKTKKKKDKLFKDVRAGKVRILLGSTEKMGAGMNVQERLVALHHIDAPWRPSDVEQREGRMIRQGNRLDDVTVYTYVTEGSFDTIMWDMLKNKAGFIEQIMNGDDTLTEMEDTGPLEFRFAHVSAVSSGDTTIIDKMNIDKKVKTLRGAKEHHRKAARKRKLTIEELTNRMPEWEADAEAWKKEAAKVVKLTEENYKIILDGKEYKNRKDAAAVIEDVFKKHKKNAFYNDPVKIGEISGFDIMLRESMTDKNVHIVMLKVLADEHGDIKNYYNPQSATGTITRIENLLGKVTDENGSKHSWLHARKTQLKELLELGDPPFKQEAELQEALDKQRELDQRMLNMARGQHEADIPDPGERTFVKGEIVDVLDRTTGKPHWRGRMESPELYKDDLLGDFYLVLKPNGVSEPVGNKYIRKVNETTEPTTPSIQTPVQPPRPSQPSSAQQQTQRPQQTTQIPQGGEMHRKVKGYPATVTMSKHTKTGADIWLVKVPRMPDDEYQSFKGFMKRHGGKYYNERHHLTQFREQWVFQRDPERLFDKEEPSEIREESQPFGQDPTQQYIYRSPVTVTKEKGAAGDDVWLVEINKYKVMRTVMDKHMKKHGGIYYAKDSKSKYAGKWLFYREPSDIFDDIDQELDNRINRDNPSGDELGFMPRPLFNTRQQRERRYTFENEAIQKRIDDAQTVPTPKFWEVMKEWLKRQKRRITREFEHLPNNAEFSPIRHRLLQLEKQRNWAMEDTVKKLQGLTTSLDHNQYELFRNMVILNDLKEENAQGHDMAFGFTPETLERETRRMEGFLRGEDTVREALELRKRLWTNIKDGYIREFKKIGVDVSGHFTRENYYRHAIIEKMKEMRTQQVAGNMQLKTPKGKGYMKRREGSDLDYITDYFFAESEVMSNMLFDIEVVKTIQLVDSKYNIEKQVKRAIDLANNRAFNVLIQNETEEELPEALGEIVDSYIQTYNLKIKADLDSRIDGVQRALKGRVGWAYAEMVKLAEARDLWPGANGEYQHIVDDLAIGESPAKEDWFSYLAELATTGEDGAKWASQYLKYNGLQKKFKREILGDSFRTINNSIPEGYTIWRPDDSNIFYMADTLPSYVAERLFNGILDEVTEGDFTKALVMGGKRRGFIIKTELSETLKNLMEPPKFSTYLTLSRKLKKWLLINPSMLFKYNARNISGDFDKLISGNPSAVKYIYQSAKELGEVFFRNRAPGRELKEFMKQGGLQSTVQSAEFGEVKHLRIFRDKVMQEELTALRKLSKVPKNLWDGYWNVARKFTDYRESILRYAAFLSYLNQIETNGGPKNYGASLREEIDALDNKYDKAFVLSNDLLIPYDKTSATGRKLRDHVIPFESFIEGNIRTYFRLFKNAYYDEELVSLVGRRLLGAMAIKAPMMAFRTGKLVMRVSALGILTMLFNHLKWPDEEEELPERVQNSMHIIYGRDKNGDVKYFDRLGTLEDFMGWFGLDNLLSDTKAVMNNEKTVLEVIGANSYKVLNKGIQTVHPFLKQGAEQIMGLKVFPDFTEPSRIHDRIEHFFSMFGMNKEYAQIRDELVGRPHRPYTPFSNWVAYTSDPEESVYYSVKEMAAKDAEKLLNKKSGTFLGEPSEKSELLYEVKLGLRYGDIPYVEQKLQEYVMAGGTERGLKQSLNSLHPLSVIPQDLRGEYFNTLDEKEQAKVERALKYYEETLLGKKYMGQ